MAVHNNYFAVGLFGSHTTWRALSWSVTWSVLRPRYGELISSLANADVSRYEIATLVLVRTQRGQGSVQSVRFSRATVRVGLDASRRWVTLSGVHQDFVAATQRFQQIHHDSYNAPRS